MEKRLLTNGRILNAGAQAKESVSAFSGVPSRIASVRRRTDRVRFWQNDKGKECKRD